MEVYIEYEGRKSARVANFGDVTSASITAFLMSESLLIGKMKFRLSPSSRPIFDTDKNILRIFVCREDE